MNVSAHQEKYPRRLYGNQKKCLICTEPPQVLSVLPCGHSTCRACITAWVEALSTAGPLTMKCPTCNRNFHSFWAKSGAHYYFAKHGDDVPVTYHLLPHLSKGQRRRLNKPRVICPLCQNKVLDAAVTPCGHSYCYACLKADVLRQLEETNVETEAICNQCPSRFSQFTFQAGKKIFKLYPQGYGPDDFIHYPIEEHQAGDQ